ncbi:PTS sugar transporter subunit IIA [Clostridium sp. AN503]|uniref:PTS sugar transporter subunit IIA n=1 Tax=Clostridium sp. AN503 TaxID=3160598 RepID=UPI0034599115
MDLDLSSMVDERLVRFDFDAATKDDAIQKIASLFYEAGKVSDRDIYTQGVLERENEFATGIGMQVAIPHCKNSVVKEAAFSMIKLKRGIDWDAFDGKPVTFIIMLAAPDDSDNAHLTMLSTLARNLMDDDFRNGLLESETIEDIKNLLSKKGV